MLRLMSIVLFTLLFNFSSEALAKECFCQRQADKETCVQGYCIHPGESQDVLLYLHGGGGDLNQWSEDGYYTTQIRDYWKEHGIPQPTVINISYGQSWLLASPNSSPDSGLFEHFTQQLIPEIMTRLSFTPNRWLLLGESMGAFNSLQLALRTQDYDKAAILCAVLGENLSPFSSIEEIMEGLRASSAYKYYGEEGLPIMLSRLESALGLARHFYPTPEEWNPFDPLSLVFQSTGSTQYYLASGYHDPFASYEGNILLADRLKAQGFEVDWRPQWGGHCAVDIPSLARFLTE